MALMDLLKRFSDPRPAIERDIRLQKACFQASKSEHPARDANAWLAMTLNGRPGCRGELSPAHFAATGSFSITNDPPVALGIFLYLKWFYEKFPQAWFGHDDGVPHFEVIQDYRRRYSDLLRPTWRLARVGRTGLRWRELNPWTAERYPEVEPIVVEFAEDQGPNMLPESAFT